ncbi:MAG: hypothetical protein ACRDTQ_06355 [Micromonosporaceae bacterium]
MREVWNDLMARGAIIGALAGTALGALADVFLDGGINAGAGVAVGIALGVGFGLMLKSSRKQESSPVDQRGSNESDDVAS